MKKFVFIIIALLFAWTAEAATLYVDDAGTDSGNCQTEGSPCKEINYAIGQASNGDTIEIMPGSYPITSESGNRVVINKDVTVTAYDTDNRPTINGNGTQTYGIQITASNATLSYVIMDMNDRDDSWNHENIRIEAEGVTLDNVDTHSGHVGVYILGGRNVTISNCKSYNHGSTGENPESGHGFAYYQKGNSSLNPTSWSDKTYFYNSEGYETGEDFYQCKSQESANPPSNWVQYVEFDSISAYDNEEDGFDFKGCRYIRIHDSEIYDNAGDGIVTHTSTSSPQSDNVEVYRNKIYGNGWWGVYVTDDCDNWEIYSNLIYNNANSSSYETYNTYGLQVKENTQVLHNTIYGNGTYASAKNHGGLRTSGTPTVQNNILYNNGTTHGNIYVSSTGTISYNYVYPTSPGITGSNAITSSDPGLTNPSGYDFTISSTGSVVYQAGTDLSITTDYAGNSFHATTPSVGAYEYETLPTTEYPGSFSGGGISR